MGDKPTFSHEAEWTRWLQKDNAWSKGTVYGRGARAAARRARRRQSVEGAAELHLCGCGQTQQQCPSCLSWFCSASGHPEHDCGGGP